MFRVRVKSTPSLNLSFESIIITFACGGHCDRRLASSARPRISSMCSYSCATLIHAPTLPPFLPSFPRRPWTLSFTSPAPRPPPSSHPTFMHHSLPHSLAPLLPCPVPPSFNYAQLGMRNEGRTKMPPTSNELLSVAVLRCPSLKGLDRAEAGESRQEEWSAASCFQKLNIAKKWNLSSAPPLPLSGIENPDEQTPCLLLQSPRVSPPPFAAPQKPHTVQRKFHNLVPTCNFDRGQGRSRCCRLILSPGFYVFSFQHFPVGWSFRVGS